MEHFPWEQAAAIFICVDFAWNHAHHVRAGFATVLAWVTGLLASGAAQEAEAAVEDLTEV